MRNVVVLDGGALMRLWDSEHPAHRATVKGVSDLRETGTRFVVPTTALIDVLVWAERDGPRRVRFIVRQIGDAFGRPQPIDFATAKLAAQLRAQHAIPTPDALVIAAGQTARATHIVTTATKLASVDPRVRLVGR